MDLIVNRHLGSTLEPFSTAYAFFLRGFFQDFRSAHLGFWDIWDGAVSLRFAASKRSEIFVILTTGN